MSRLVKLKGLGAGLVPPREKRIVAVLSLSCNKKSASRGAQLWDTNTLLENTIANLNVHIVEEKVEHFRNFLWH